MINKSTKYFLYKHAIVQTGIPTYKASATVDGNICAIRTQDVSESEVKCEIYCNLEIENIDEKHFLQLNDIIIKSRGYDFSSGIIKKLSSKTIALSPLYVIRVNSDEITPEFLHWHLNQDNTLKLLQNLSKGTSTQILTVKSLNNILLPIPPTDIQKEILEIDNLIKNKTTAFNLTIVKQKKILQDILRKFYEE